MRARHLPLRVTRDLLDKQAFLRAEMWRRMATKGVWQRIPADHIRWSQSIPLFRPAALGNFLIAVLTAP